jgi:endonuclease/exonuclease/phosphatase family metal-dependent hydrolase
MKRALLLACVLAGCAAPARRPDNAPLRVATYNIQAGAGDLGRIAKEIEGINADLVALQEVDVHWHERSGFVDQATELGRMLRVDVRFAPIYRLPGSDAAKPFREFGVAILSRHPIVEFRNDTLTRHSTQDSSAGPTPMPGLAEAVVNINGQRVRVFATHLDYRADPRVRAQQVLEMRGYLDRSADPTIVFGDLNATPWSYAFTELVRGTCLRDSREGRGYQGSFPVGLPFVRIPLDHVLVGDGVAVLRRELGPDVGSDHLPVEVDLAVW